MFQRYKEIEFFNKFLEVSSSQIRFSAYPKRCCDEAIRVASQATKWNLRAAGEQEGLRRPFAIAPSEAIT